MRISRLLIANRGEVVARIARTARRLGIRTVGVYSEPDADSPALHGVDLAVPLDGVTSTETYLSIDALLGAAERTGADAVHPGFGFHAENPDFARAVIAAGLTWVGPHPDHIAAMGDKIAAKRIAADAGLPVLPTVAVGDGRIGVDIAADVSFPLLVKAAAGGGGKGMRRVDDAAGLEAAVETARGEALRSFGDDTVYLERLVSPARHVEVQVVGDGSGGAIHLFERECSIQRRNQKVVEEAPSALLDDARRKRMCDAAARLAAEIGYAGAGTVEFVADPDGEFFIEMNTRLQVEHPVTEEITGIDIVELQLDVACGRGIAVDQDDVAIDGHAIEVRLYAEDPALGWTPAVGTLHTYRRGTGPARYEDAVASGIEVTPHYDPMLGKVIAKAPDRATAAELLAAELDELRIHGPATNRNTLAATLRHPVFLAGDTTTSFFDDHPEVLDADVDPATLRSHLAAVLWARQARHRAADGLWGAAPSGWRNVPSQPQQLRLGRRATTHELSYQVDGSSLTADGLGDRIAARVVAHEDPWVMVELDGVARRVEISCAADMTWANSTMGQSAWRELSPFPAHDPTLAAGGPAAPVPGTVVGLLVSAGDVVEPGDPLVLIEAMKMEHRIAAPARARVTSVRVAVGDQVDTGDLLVELEEVD